jgi:hypothetical protein
MVSEKDGQFVGRHDQDAHVDLTGNDLLSQVSHAHNEQVTAR